MDLIEPWGYCEDIKHVKDIKEVVDINSVKDIMNIVDVNNNNNKDSNVKIENFIINLTQYLSTWN